jgi:Flp pilus assembly protein TadG
VQEKVMMQHHIRRTKRRRGATLVEFAFVLPILLGVLIGVVEFGWLVKTHLTLANATREGARAAAVGKTTAEIRTRIMNAAAPISLAAPSGNITLQVSTDNGTTFVAWPGDFNGRNGVLAGNLIKVSVTYKHRSLTGFFPFLSNYEHPLAVTMRREA